MKPTISQAIPASHSRWRAIRRSNPELFEDAGASMPAFCCSTVPSANSSAEIRAKTTCTTRRSGYAPGTAALLAPTNSDAKPACGCRCQQRIPTANAVVGRAFVRALRMAAVCLVNQLRPSRWSSSEPRAACPLDTRSRTTALRREIGELRDRRRSCGRDLHSSSTGYRRWRAAWLPVSDRGNLERRGTGLRDCPCFVDASARARMRHVRLVLRCSSSVETAAA